MTRAKRIQHLKASAIFIALFGLPALMVPFGFIQPLLNLFLDIVYLPFDGLPVHEGRASAILFVITGGLTMGLAMQIYCVAEWVMPDQPELGRRLILYPLFAWFICDSTASVLVGAPFNAVLNLGFLLPPLFALRGEFNEKLAASA